MFFAFSGNEHDTLQQMPAFWRKNMKKLLLIGILTTMFVSDIGCTNMGPTEQAILSGAAVGALGGWGIAAIAGGTTATAALVGAGVGGLAGGAVALQ
ncbi:MAG: cell envelope biogenesis protein OmpA [Desulfovibrio sp.]|jgi:hypothetical protein|nr:cell envelope biogenesis protein OmpA [Desulfovibrio sp.]